MQCPSDPVPTSLRTRTALLCSWNSHPASLLSSKPSAKSEQTALAAAKPCQAMPSPLFVKAVALFFPQPRLGLGPKGLEGLSWRACAQHAKLGRSAAAGHSASASLAWNGDASGSPIGEPQSFVAASETCFPEAPCWVLHPHDHPRVDLLAPRPRALALQTGPWAAQLPDWSDYQVTERAIGHLPGFAMHLYCLCQNWSGLARPQASGRRIGRGVALEASSRAGTRPLPLGLPCAVAKGLMPWLLRRVGAVRWLAALPACPLELGAD